MSASNQSQPVVNDFLAFLQQKEKLLLEDGMDLETAVQFSTRASSFTVEHICEAKQVLCQSLGIVGKYVPHRKGDETGAKTLADIKKILREYQDRIPEFVEQDAILPSRVPDNIDVRCLFEDIVALKTSLAEIILKFEAAQDTIAELRNEVNSLRNSALTRSVASNFKTDDRPSTLSADSASLRVADTLRPEVCTRYYMGIEVA